MVSIALTEMNGTNRIERIMIVVHFDANNETTESCWTSFCDNNRCWAIFPTLLSVLHFIREANFKKRLFIRISIPFTEWWSDAHCHGTVLRCTEPNAQYKYMNLFRILSLATIRRNKHTKRVDLLNFPSKAIRSSILDGIYTTKKKKKNKKNPFTRKLYPWTQV